MGWGGLRGGVGWEGEVGEVGGGVRGGSNGVRTFTVKQKAREQG